MSISMARGRWVIVLRPFRFQRCRPRKTAADLPRISDPPHGSNSGKRRRRAVDAGRRRNSAYATLLGSSSSSSSSLLRLSSSSSSSSSSTYRLGELKHGQWQRLAKKIAFIAHPHARNLVVLDFHHAKWMAAGFQNDDVAWLQIHDYSLVLHDTIRTLAIGHDKLIMHPIMATLPPVASTRELNPHCRRFSAQRWCRGRRAG